VRDWHRRRMEAAARALADAEGEGNLRRAELAVHAADRAGGGIVPLQDFEGLALDFSAWRVRALQDEDLLGRALTALDCIADAGEDTPAGLRELAFATAVEVRAMLDARRDSDGDEP
jgi:hypothetical protein